MQPSAGVATLTAVAVLFAAAFVVALGFALSASASSSGQIYNNNVEAYTLYAISALLCAILVISGLRAYQASLSQHAVLHFLKRSASASA
jgi:hypothetical protein